MYEGYLRFDGTEVINMERLMAYVAAGITPAGIVVEDCTGTCDGLGEAVGDGDYTSPLQDEPPWFDPENPDTLDFAGVMPLEVTGLDGSVRTVEMVNLLARGAIPMRPTYPGRTVAVSAFLIGRTSAGVEAGLAWLTNVLHRICSPDVTCVGSDLIAYTSCPTPICPGGTSNPDEPITETHQPYSAQTWLLAGGAATDADTFQTFNPTTQALLAGPVFVPQAHYIADWTVTARPVATPVQVWVGAVSEDGGTILDQQGPYTVTTGQLLRWEVLSTPPVNFRPAVWVLGPGVDFTLTTWSQPVLSDLDCIAPYRRTYPQVVTVDGPTVTGSEVTHCGEKLLYVTWTWVAGSPFRYGTPTVLIAGLTSTVQETQEAAGVIGTPMGVISATPYNCLPRTAPVTCAPDPCYQGFTAPPAGPVIPDPRRPNITTQQIHAASVYVPATLIPDTQGVFSFILGNDIHDKVGVRIRVYDDVPGTGVPSDLCDFAYEFLIDYIAPEAVFIIDGVSGTGTVLCDGATQEVDASTVVRGAYGGPVTDPVAACGRSYYVIAQWLNTYPWSCPATGSETGKIYKAGDPQGEMTLAVSVAPREG